MREILWFFASLAGAAILTALAAIMPPQSPVWRGILYGGICILLTCAILIFLDMRRPLKERKRVVPLIGMVVLMKPSRDYIVQLTKKADGTPDENIKMSYSVYLDFASKSQFYTFYISNTNKSDQTASVAETISSNYSNMADNISSDVLVWAKDPADSESTAGHDLIFTGRIYIYHETEMSIAQRGWLETVFQSKGASVVFRGPDYRTTRWLQERASAERS
jgi:hypothetical protein